MKKVSVIIPIYNVEDYLPKCLDSIINQTYKNLEIILINDGSPDNCGVICDEYAKCDDRIIVVHQENQGVSVARNTGLDICSGDYIVFCDPDDYVELDMYEKLVSLAQINNVDVVVCARNDVEDNEILPVDILDKYCGLQNRQEAIENIFTTHFSVGPCNKLFKKSLLITKDSISLYFPIGVKVGEDALFIAKLFTRAENFFFTNTQLYNYVTRKTSATNTRFQNVHAMKSIIWCMEECANIVEPYVSREYINEMKATNHARCHSLFCKMIMISDDEAMDALPYLKKDKIEFIKSNTFPVIKKLKLIVRTAMLKNKLTRPICKVYLKQKHS